jgi:ubiquitin-activating enzyme E1
MFNHKIQQLLHSFPLDRVTSSGTLFWSGAKRPPSPLLFSADDPLHLEFVEAAANLRAHMFSLPVQEDRGMLLRVILDVTLPAFQIKEGTRIPATDEEARAMAEARATEQDVDAQCAGLVLELRQLTAVDRVHLSSIDFDKDVDAHMRVVAACSNLRARNYAIPEADLYTSRGIAGRIVPAIATTTALVTGLICLEVYKILLNKPISAHANTFTNLAISLFTSMEPEPPKVTTSVVKGQEWKWTPLDKIVVDTPGITLRSLIALLSSEYGLSLSMLSSGVSILYSDFMNKKKLVERMDQSVKEIFESVSKKQLPAGTKYLILEVIANDEDTDDEVELPYLRLRLY